MTTRKTEETAVGNERAEAQAPTVKWDDSEITNSYSNVCNVTSSREEVVLAFGLNKAWDRAANEVHIKLSSRIILSPFAAKRLALLLNSVLQQYESRFGTLELGTPRPTEPVTGQA